MKKNILYIIIPLYNESKAFLSFKVWLTELIEYLMQIRKEYLEFSFILIDNGSKDNTFNLLSTLKLPYTDIISIKKNSGYGAGIKYGIKYALSKSKNNCFLTWLPSDAQYPSKECYEAINQFNKNIKFSNSGIFLSKRKNRSDKLSTQIISKIFNIVNSICDHKLIGEDINSLPKIIKSNLFTKILKTHKLPNDFFFELMLMKFAVRSNSLYKKRLYIDFVERQYGKSSWNRSDIKKLFNFFIKAIQTHILFAH